MDNEPINVHIGNKMLKNIEVSKIIKMLGVKNIEVSKIIKMLGVMMNPSMDYIVEFDFVKRRWRHRLKN